MAAVLLGFETLVSDSDTVISFIDNEGVLSAVLNGSSRSAETNIAVGKLWLDLARRNIISFAARVESKANISDEPSRLVVDNLAHLGATFVEPRLPNWVYEVWNW